MQLAIEHQETERLIRASACPSRSCATAGTRRTSRSRWASPCSTGPFWAPRARASSRRPRAPTTRLADATVLLQDDYPAQAIYERLATAAFTLAQLARKVSQQAGKPVAYKNLPAEAYTATLVSFGLPQGLAAVLADSDATRCTGRAVRRRRCIEP